MTVRTDWWGLARESMTNPRVAARVLLGLRLPMGVLWQLLLLVAIVSDLLLFGELILFGGSVTMLGQLADPILLAGMQFASMVVMVMAVHGIGHAFGGQGDWAGAMAVVIWLQAIRLGVQLAQIVAAMLVPQLAQVVGIAALVLMLWLLTNFIAVLHGFSNIWLVLVAVVAAGAVLMFGLSYLLVALGLFVPGVA